MSRLAREADELRARWLLAQERTDDARPVVRRLGQDGGATLLSIVLGSSTADRSPTSSASWSRAGDARRWRACSLAVRGARGGVDARVEVLEQLRARRGGSQSLVDEALVQAYWRARAAALDAKRIALEELRARGVLGTALATELREALAFEAQPLSQRRTRPSSRPATCSRRSRRSRRGARLLADHARRGGAGGSGRAPRPR